MKVLNIPFFYILVILLFAGCKKDKQDTPNPDSNKPDIETVDATVYPDGGVTLKGRINKLPLGLKQLGFVISTDSLLKTPLNIVLLKQIPLTGNFTVDINGGIIKDKKYYYAAYEVDSTFRYKLYNKKYFVASGSRKVKINSIYPLKADIGDTLTITGKYFTGQPITVKFDQQPADLIPKSDSVLQVVVTPYLTNAKPLITLSANSQTDTLSDKFSLFAPVITNFTLSGTFRDVVVINGDHFRSVTGTTEVKFGNIKATIQSAGKKQLQVIVPDDLEHSASKVTVTAQFQSTTGAGVFQITKPQITKATLSGYVGDVVTIEGKYFHPDGYRNGVIFETTAAGSVSGNTTKLTAEIPNGGYPRRKATIKVKVLDDIVAYNVDLKINDKWVVVNNSLPFSLGYTVGAFTINNVSYVVAALDNDYQTKYLWRLNPADFSWQRISMPFGFETGLVTAVGGKAYLFANSSSSSSFWEYDAASGSWTKKANFTTNPRHAATIFSIGTKIYLGLGFLYSSNSNNNDPDNSFYEYNIAQNVWKRVADYPAQFSDGVRVNATSFTLGNTAYVGGGASNTGMYSYYSYAPAANSWTKIADFPDARSNAIPFTINGYGYVAGGIPVGGSPYRDYYKYNATANTWTKMNETIGIWPLGATGIDYGFSFINNGNVYIGCMGSGTGTFQLLQAYGSQLN